MQQKVNKNKKIPETKKDGLNYLQWFAIITAIALVFLVIIIDYYYRIGCI